MPRGLPARLGLRERTANQLKAEPVTVAVGGTPGQLARRHGASGSSCAEPSISATHEWKPRRVGQGTPSTTVASPTQVSIGAVVSSTHSIGGSPSVGVSSQTRTTFRPMLRVGCLHLRGRTTVKPRPVTPTCVFRALRGGCSFAACARLARGLADTEIVRESCGSSPDTAARKQTPMSSVPRSRAERLSPSLAPSKAPEIGCVSQS
jgi:hypothetical protein